MNNFIIFTRCSFVLVIRLFKKTHFDVTDKIRALEDPAARQHLLTLLDTAKNNIELAVSVSELRLAE